MAEHVQNGVRRAGWISGMLASIAVVLTASFGGGRVIAVDLWGLAPTDYVDAAVDELAAKHARDMARRDSLDERQDRLLLYLACTERYDREGYDPTACRTHLESGDLPDLPRTDGRP